jgi:CubicO group peptidase (beta-lactamase class C family)
MALAPLPAQPANVAWPTKAWPQGDFPGGFDSPRLGAALGRAFAGADPDLGETHALVIVQGGRLLLERYAPDFGPDVTCKSWSMAKSITHALTGLAVADGKIDISAPADVPEWRGPGDPRGAITLDHLLRMSSGLAFREAYVPGEPSDVIEMLSGAGRADMAAFAASFPLAHRPDEVFYYSSGTTNIICRCLARALGAAGDAFKAYMFERLFDPIGMTSALPRFDDAGTFIGSSYCFATPQDFARFGLLYMRGGVWDGRRILPEGWVDYARTRTFQQADCPDGPYGAHWWLDAMGPGSFSAHGYEGQYLMLRPRRDLILVRHGVTPEANHPRLRAWLGEIADLFG